MSEGSSGSASGEGKERISVVAAVIEQDGRYLLTKRAAKAVLPGYWEFPGGKVEPGETPRQALAREVRERICVDVQVGPLLARRVHDYGDYEVELSIYDANILAGSVRPGTVAEVAWVPRQKLGDYSFPPADREAMDLLLGRRVQ